MTAAEMPLLEDPVAEASFVDLWLRRAQRNTHIYREVFHCLPDDTVASWPDYHRFLALTANRPERERALEMLADVRGHVVAWPLNFLSQVILDPTLGSGESFIPMEVFL